mmetsp:Transcript_95300/g.139170  ORF Transcript_95300/g.139170 Transcript_95300/m.139170 type:complete len:236 (-) Transcript_95300:524-1231(-)
MSLENIEHSETISAREEIAPSISSAATTSPRVRGLSMRKRSANASSGMPGCLYTVSQILARKFSSGSEKFEAAIIWSLVDTLAEEEAPSIVNQGPATCPSTSASFILSSNPFTSASTPNPVSTKISSTLSAPVVSLPAEPCSPSATSSGVATAPFAFSLLSASALLSPRTTVRLTFPEPPASLPCSTFPLPTTFPLEPPIPALAEPLPSPVPRPSVATVALAAEAEAEDGGLCDL